MKTEGPFLENIPAELVTNLSDRLTTLRNALEKNDPLMKNHLAASHKVIVSYPEVTPLLEDADIKLLLDAAQKHMQLSIVQAAAKGKGRAKSYGVGDL